MVTGTPCHSAMLYVRRSLVYSHFVIINRIMTLGFWNSQRIKSLQFYFIHGTYSDYILCNIECIIIYPPLFMFVLLYSWCGPRTLCNNQLTNYFAIISERYSVLAYWYVVVNVIYIILIMKVLNMRDNKMCL